MKRVLSTCVAIFLAGAIGIAKAEVYNPNPNGRIEILGADGVFLTSPSQVSTEGFAVRLTDPLGNPLVGIEVEFIAPALVLPPVMPPDYVPPDTRLWGRFPTGVSVSVLTDAQGIARSGPFTGGTIPRYLHRGRRGVRDIPPAEPCRLRGAPRPEGGVRREPELLEHAHSVPLALDAGGARHARRRDRCLVGTPLRTQALQLISRSAAD